VLSGPGQGGLFAEGQCGYSAPSPFFSSSQDSKEGLTGVLPPSPGLLWRKRGESEYSSFQHGLR